ncbi:MAG TPA: alkaline phosphatase [Phycisphaerae bacterium]|nr:alkaline phosphatase [Phycisphaerae bacterium]
MTRIERRATCWLAVACVGLWLAAGCAPSVTEQQVLSNQGVPKYVFLFIGDGMGVAHVHAAEIYLGAVENAKAGKSGPGMHRLTMTQFPVSGLITTYSASSQVTDSAAAGTALATGHKTSNGTVSMDPDGRLCYTSVATAARARGMKVGIVSSTCITDATPAVFYAHQPYRGEQYEVGLQLAASPFEYIAGSEVGEAEGPQGNILDIARSKGVQVATSRYELATCRPGRRVFFQEKIPYEIDRPPHRVSLAELTAKGIELLDNPDGFFMMVEGGKIDGGGHNNDAAATIGEVLALDAAIDEAMRFYRKHPLETLIVVTADHETGAMALNNDYKRSPLGMAVLAGQTQSWNAFSFEVFNSVKETQTWTSTGDNIPEDLWQALGSRFGLTWDTLTDAEKTMLEDAYDASMASRGKVDEKGRRLAVPGYSRYEPLPLTAAKLVGYRAGIGWSTFGHSPMPVPVWAVGAAAWRFDGFNDNTDIPKGLAAAMRIELPEPQTAAEMARSDSAAPRQDYTNRADMVPARK